MERRQYGNIRVSNYTNDNRLMDAVCAVAEMQSYPHGEDIDVRITGVAPQRKPFESWEGGGVIVCEGQSAIQDALTSGCKNIWVKSATKIYCW